MTVFVELVTGMVHNVLYVHQILIGMVKLVSLVMVVEFGIILILFVNAQLTLNGMVLHVLKLALMEKFLRMVFVFVLKVNLKIMENASTILFVKMELNGMVSNVLVFLALQVILIAVDAAAVKLQSMHVLLVLIGMVTDVFMSQTSVQPV